MVIRGNKTFGSILLVGGTSIGAGMLALPLTTGAGGFFSVVNAIFWCICFYASEPILSYGSNLNVR